MAETTQDQQPKTSSGLAIAGLVLGILAILGSFLPIINNLSFFLALIGGILALIALIGAIRGKHTAKGLSIAGVVLAVVSIVVVLVTQSAFSAAIDSASEELKTGSKPVSSSTESAAPEEKKEESKDADYSNMKLGEAVKLENGLSITVNSVQPGESTYDGTPTVVASVTYTNEGDSNESFNILDWKCVNENGVEKSCTYSIQDSEQLDSGKLNAGGTVTGNVHFEGSPTKILYYSNLLQSESQIAWVVE